ncbi:hypothetical protein [Parashewanella curva]|nr:hypothetical protein [Parashewanella curva]
MTVASTHSTYQLQSLPLATSQNLESELSTFISLPNEVDDKAVHYFTAMVYRRISYFFYVKRNTWPDQEICHQTFFEHQDIKTLLTNPYNLAEQGVFMKRAKSLQIYISSAVTEGSTKKVAEFFNQVSADSFMNIMLLTESLLNDEKEEQNCLIQYPVMRNYFVAAAVFMQGLHVQNQLTHKRNQLIEVIHSLPSPEAFTPESAIECEITHEDLTEQSAIEIACEQIWKPVSKEGLIQWLKHKKKLVSPLYNTPLGTYQVRAYQVAYFPKETEAQKTCLSRPSSSKQSNQHTQNH